MNGPNLAKMAWRNLWKNRRRTLITLLSISFGGFMAVMMTALQDRSFSDFIDTAARNGGGHVTLAHPEYIKKHSLLNTVGGTDALLSMATADLGVQTAVPRIGGQIMLSTARGSRGTAFIAVDPQRETDETFTFWDGLVEGKAFVSADDRGIVMGEKLARKLGISLGSVGPTRARCLDKLRREVERLQLS